MKGDGGGGDGGGGSGGGGGGVEGGKQVDNLRTKRKQKNPPTKGRQLKQRSMHL